MNTHTHIVHRCYLGLGSNLNNPIKQLRTAISHIQRLPQTYCLKSASWYQSKAWGVKEQNDFINTVIEIKTTLTPLALLKAIKIIEYRLMQRQSSLKWHARKIDIDLLLYGQMRLRRNKLIIPHPWIHQRDFVYTPLLELKPLLPIELLKKLNTMSKSHNTDSKLKLITPGFAL